MARDEGQVEKGAGSVARWANESIFMKHRINFVHAALLLGPILLAIVFLSFGLNRMRSDVCAQPFRQDMPVRANGCR